MTIRRITAAILFFGLLLGCIPAVQTNAATEGDFTYEVIAGEVTITGYTGTGGNITIPSTIDGCPVTAVGAGAFADCTNLTSVNIPDTVTVIGKNAFNNCAGLTAIIIPDGVERIKSGTFYRCTELTEVTIPGSVELIEEQAFYQCRSLTKVIYCGTEYQWWLLNMNNNNESLHSARLQYHNWTSATCTVPMTCSCCGMTQGGVAHNWNSGTCTGCGKNMAEAADLSGDGKVTAFDAQILAEAQAGLRELTDAQWQALGNLKPSDIVDYILGRY